MAKIETLTKGFGLTYCNVSQVRAIISGLGLILDKHLLAKLS